MSDYNFKGIKPESIELLCLNKFNDSRAFYEEHKEELKQGITVPMRQIMLDLSELMYDIDDKMLTDPVRSVSRIYRDTRGNRNKIKYRENMWMFFRRYKNEYPSAPFYYFEFFPNSFGYGLVLWLHRPAAFKEVHNLILKHPDRWLDAVKACQEAGFVCECRNEYKKELYPNAPDELKPYLKAKDISFSYYSTDLSRINTPALIDELKLAFDIARPMYEFLIEAYENMMNKGLIKPEDFNR
ncbi:MAG: DUF2461 domain-containing protein [Acetobacter sp.]|nr:DUF2461 domain-containing protein [Bacteroides sp.]MCM1340574.1 DUF2461 domain-containing protein [Acetobacter sp.]MCM1433314.1 DUF2461 domain-containing protein [Clostridiales bacterium]